MVMGLSSSYPSPSYRGSAVKPYQGARPSEFSNLERRIIKQIISIAYFSVDNLEHTSLIESGTKARV